ncbi:MAG: FAD-linked oxidase C-terminal domain-containing protein [Verrucomicrobiales bacterium]|nr:FAD-linked oxidase C-terminal domain-containing protein [Verrucomicrobiales bacterium]
MASHRIESSNLVSRLSSIVGKEDLLTEPEDLVPYGFDGTAALKQSAVCVVTPRTVEAVAAIVSLAAAENIPVVTRGSGTGLSGGSIPVDGGIVLCLVNLDEILEIDPANLTMLCQPGVITKAIDDAAAPFGLFYPPDPGSMKISTIGGNVANNSGGLRGLKYGVTRDYVMGMEVVLPSGEVCWLGSKCVKDVAGYSMKDLFVGSEGTLGIITKVLLKLVPRPKARRTLLASFDSMEAAARTVSEIIEKQIIPCTLEFLDRKTCRCVEDYAKVGLPTEAAAVVLMETDGHPSVVDEEADAMAAIAESNGAITVEKARDEAHATKLASARRTAFSALARIRPTTILEDVTVPRSRLVEIVSFVEETGRKYDLDIATFGHFGDGNVHPTILTDETDTEEMERVEHALSDIIDKTIELGGTITGEHGVGLAKKPFLPRQFSEASFSLLRQVKVALDPLGILNPGKIFDPAGEAKS